MRAWLKIAAALRSTLESLQRAAGKTLLEISGGNPAQPGEGANAAAKPVEPEEYEFPSAEAHTLDRMLRNVDLHKLHQTGWHYHMSEWRGAIREQARGLDHLVHSLRNQLDLFVKMHHILLGNETGRIVPLRPPKMKPPAPKRGKKPQGGKRPQIGRRRFFEKFSRLACFRRATPETSIGLRSDSRKIDVFATTPRLLVDFVMVGGLAPGGRDSSR